MSANSPVLRVPGLASIVLAAVLAMSACTTPSNAPIEPTPTMMRAIDPATGIFDRTWQFGSTSLDSESRYESQPIEAPPTLRFESDGVVHGWTGCREFSAEWVQSLSDGAALDSTGIVTSKVVVGAPACVASASSSRGPEIARDDARILAAIDESTAITIGEYGLLTVAGAEQYLVPEPALTVNFFDADEDGLGTWVSISGVNWDSGNPDLDPDTREHGPLVGRWTLVSGRYDDHEINPAKLLALDSQPGRRTVWTFDGTTFSTGSGCAAASGTLKGKLNRTFSAEVTAIGSCVLDRDPGARVDYDLEADQVLAAIDSLDHAEADADHLILQGGLSDQLTFTRAD